MPKPTQLKPHAEKMSATVTSYLIDQNPVRWQRPYTLDVPNIFYFSFAPHSVEGKAKTLTPVDEATQQLLRAEFRKASSYANVELREHNDWSSLPADARKIIIAESSTFHEYYPRLTTLENYQAQYEDRIPQMTHIAAGTSFIIPQAPQSQTSHKTAPIADTKVIILADNLLQITGKDFTVEYVTSQLFKAIGLQPPCESFVADLQKGNYITIQEGEKREAIAHCNDLLSPYTIMASTVRTESIEECMRKQVGWDFNLNKTDSTHQEAFYDCTYKADPTIKQADKDALARVLGPVPSPKVSNAFSTQHIVTPIAVGLTAGYALAQSGINRKLATAGAGVAGFALLAHGLQEGNPATFVSGLGLISTAIGITVAPQQGRGGR